MNVNLCIYSTLTDIYIYMNFNLIYTMFRKKILITHINACTGNDEEEAIQFLKIGIL